MAEFARTLSIDAGKPEIYEPTLVELSFASMFGQLAFHPDRGFVAWLRAPLELEPALRGPHRVEAMGALLAAGEACSGPLLLVTDLYAPGHGFAATRWLTRLPGVQRICGEAQGTPWRSIPCRG